MPTYQYRCTTCERRFEQYQSFTDDPVEVCPLPARKSAKGANGKTCGGAVRKVFSSIGIAFKGSGFYRNDSRAGAAAGRSAEKSGTADGAGTDAKPAADSTKSDGDSAGSPAGDAKPKDAKPKDAKPKTGTRPASGKPDRKPAGRSGTGSRKPAAAGRR
ncbi:MAG TPA: hypothetical protein DEP69_06430 [Acidimicrobiaceae bacterium]|nr:hypothetical protein [Acidimicrobiaceae bacterium]